MLAYCLLLVSRQVSDRISIVITCDYVLSDRFFDSVFNVATARVARWSNLVLLLSAIFDVLLRIRHADLSPASVLQPMLHSLRYAYHACCRRSLRADVGFAPFALSIGEKGKNGWRREAQ